MQQLLRLLADGRFHSGEELGRALGISRSAVWKRLRTVSQQQFLKLHSVPGKGYRLEQPLSLLRREALEDQLGICCHVEECVDSTNAVALRHLAALRSDTPFVVLAEHQSEGRGRRGRVWISPYAQNLYLSYVLRVENAQYLQALSLAVGVAVLRTLEPYGMHGIGLKWPNDILVNSSKLAGILLELTGDPADVCHVVIGIGINANLMEASNINQAWTSIQRETLRLIDRNKLAVRLVKNLERLLGVHIEHGFPAHHAEWEEKHLWQGRDVRLMSGASEVLGRVIGVTPDGALRLDVDGSEQTFSGGELTLRLQ